MRLFVFLFRASRGLLLAALLASLVSGFGSALMVSYINRALNIRSAELTGVGVQFAVVALGVAGWEAHC